MSWLSDIFGGDTEQATNDQVQGLVQGANAAEIPLQQNPGIITSYGGQALAPYSTNYNTASAGLTGSSNQLGNLLGLNGATGTQSALTNLQTTPGYQFTKGQGEGAINAAAAAGGTLNSGNQLTALSNYNTGLAQNTYNSAVGNAQSAVNSYGNLANSSAGGMAGVLGGEASALTGNNNTLAQLLQSTYAGAGNAQASGELAKQQSGQSLLGGAVSLGSSLLGSLGGLGGIGSSLGGLFGGGTSGLIDNASLGSSIGGLDLGF